MFEGRVLGFLGFFNGKVSVIVFEKIILEFYVSRPFVWLILLFNSSKLHWFLDLYIPWKLKKFSLTWILITF